MFRTIRFVVLLSAISLAACSPDAAQPTAPVELDASLVGLQGHGHPSSAQVNRDLAAARQATAHFQQFERALEAGYDAQFPPGCFEIEEGGQGYHFLNAGFLGEDYASGVAGLEVTRPQMLMYEPQKNGRMRLVGIEYVVPGDGTETPPVLFGQHLHYVEVFGVWALHVWNWRHNPSGMFADWNPHVTCEHT